MKNSTYFGTLLSFLLITVALPAFAQEYSTVRRDGGLAGGVHNNPGSEASVILEPEGPCRLVGLRIYFPTATPASDTIWIVGDAAAGAVPPTSWVWSYNTIAPPFIIQYDGTPGWKEYDLSEMNIHIDGHDRVVIQHRIDPNGLLWGVDNNSQKTPYGSFLMDPAQNNSLGFPGLYQLAAGDFMVRLLVEYDYPEGDGSAPPPLPTMVDVTESAGLVGPNGPISSARVSVADWNNDGWDDVAAGSNFWQNNGDGTFTRMDMGIIANTTVWGDYDNDGDLDCFGVRGGKLRVEKLPSGGDTILMRPDTLWRNNGDGTFTNVFGESGIRNYAPTVTPIWFDFDRDGYLDLFISNGRIDTGANATYTEIFFQDRLWRNNGDGTFSDVTADVGIPAAESGLNTDCWGAAPTDYNRDGRTDIFVATYRLAPDVLYRNNSDGTFTDVAAATGVRGVPTAEPQYFGHGIGADWADYNNDGLVDLTVGNLGHPDWRGRVSNPSLVYRNEGGPDYRFTEVRSSLGVKFFEMNTGVVWGDFDLDGYQDLFHCHYSYQKEGASGEPARLSRLYFNGGPGEDWRLHDRTWDVGLRIHGAWTAARLDYDRDGDLDLLVATPHEKLTLYRNDLPLKGKGIIFRLQGEKEAGIPEDGYGTRVTVHNGDQLFFRELQGGGSGATGTQNSNALHFGVGETETVDSVVVEWADGERQVFRNVATEREYRVRYGTSNPEEIYNLLSVDDRSGSKGETGSRFAVSNVRYEEGYLAFNLSTTRRLPMTVEVSNTLGEVIVKKRFPNVVTDGWKIELPGKPAAGIYLVRFTDGEMQEVVKVRVGL